MCLAEQRNEPTGPRRAPAEGISASRSAVGRAIAQANSALTLLASCNAAGLTAGEQAEHLIALERASSMLLAARSAILGNFAARRGYEDDGQGSVRVWLSAHTKVTRTAASAAIGWTRRLSAHPAVRDALAAGTISASWARHICDWTDLVPDEHRARADQILLAAARDGVTLDDLAALAEQIRRATARPDRDADRFEDRWLRIRRHWRGAARLDGELTPQAAAALTAVLNALGKKAGPEDIRTQAQRDHDALEEACRRLIASKCLPERAGQPTQIQLHMPLSQLWSLTRRDPSQPDLDLDLDPDQHGLNGTQDKHPVGQVAAGHDAAGHDAAGHDAAGDPAAWTGRGLAPAAPGDECDAAIVPTVTGHVDPTVLDNLVRDWRGGTGIASGRGAGRSSARALADALTRQAVSLLSGPSGLAARLRRGSLTGPAASVSLPLDVGAATDTVPAHLRRALATRDRGCRFPGCDQPPPACHPHHIVPRADSGPTSLSNLISLCSFHHLIAIHRWGWAITLHGDGTITAANPQTGKVLTDRGLGGQRPSRAGQDPPEQVA